MPITSSDLVEYQSASAGSTGGAITGSSITSGVKNNVWPDITDTDRIAGGTLYRKTFWKNNNGSFAAQLPVIYIPVFPSNMTLTIGLGVDSSDDTDQGQGNLTAWSANAKVSLTSDGTDTRVATIYGLDNSGTPVPTTENVTLTSASEVLSSATYSAVYAVWLASTSGTRTVTIKQGASGTTRGTIGTTKKISFLWVSAGTAKTSGIQLPNLAASQSYGVWRKLTWAPAATATKPDTLTIRIEENA